MIIDIIYLILVVMAITKGFSRGLIVAVFSYIAIIIGLAAALKLSSGIAGWLHESAHFTMRWLPVFSFLLVMVAVVFAVRTGAGLIQKSARLLMLGWIDRLGGILLYWALYTTVFSVFLFFMAKIHLLPGDIDTTSRMYDFIKPWGPGVINGFGVLIPWFRNMFTQLETFFGSAAAPVK